MGKATGFIDYSRIEQNHIDPKERINSYNEFIFPLPEEKRKEQAARCMNCGVPFCSSNQKINNQLIGCPLANNICEFNDLIYKGLYKEAYYMLEKTSPFSEFTGRVCPACCESACVSHIIGQSTTNKDNELFIIENAFKNGYVMHTIKNRTNKKVCVIGSGPSGLSAAHYLNLCGHNVTVYEKSDQPGGLLMYGIPNMKLDKQIVLRRVELMKKEGIRFVLNANIADLSELEKEYDAIVLALGTNKAREINLDNSNAKGIHYALTYLKDATYSLLNNKENEITALNKHVVIIGGGDTGSDCLATAIRQRAIDVKEIEIMSEPPKENKWPFFQKVKKNDYAIEEYLANYNQDPRMYNTRVCKINTNDNNEVISLDCVSVKWENKKPIDIEDSKHTIKADLVLIAMGFIGNDEAIISYESSKVFKCGDCFIGQSLVAKAIADGKRCANDVNEYLKESN